MQKNELLNFWMGWTVHTWEPTHNIFENDTFFLLHMVLKNIATFWRQLDPRLGMANSSYPRIQIKPKVIGTPLNNKQFEVLTIHPPSLEKDDTKKSIFGEHFFSKIIFSQPGNTKKVYTYQTKAESLEYLTHTYLKFSKHFKFSKMKVEK